MNILRRIFGCTFGHKWEYIGKAIHPIHRMKYHWNKCRRCEENELWCIRLSDEDSWHLRDRRYIGDVVYELACHGIKFEK